MRQSNGGKFVARDCAVEESSIVLAELKLIADEVKNVIGKSFCHCGLFDAMVVGECSVYSYKYSAYVGTVGFEHASAR